LEESIEGRKSIFGWVKDNVQLISIVGSIVFWSGVMYSNVQNLDKRVDAIEKIDQNLGKMSISIAALGQQIEDANKAQDDTNKQILYLGSSISKLDESTTELKTKVEDNFKKRK
jgi:chromosome segregation ATPase